MAHAFIINAADAVYAPAQEQTLPTKPSATPTVLVACALAALLALAELFLPLRWGRRTEGHL